MKTIRWGIIGVGDVTEVKSGPAFYKSTNSQLVAVMRRNGDKAKDFAQRHGVARWYDDGEALINDSDVDVVYIATPQYAHKDYALQAAAAGKHVYSEKPMALNYNECQQMIEACEQAGVSLWVGYYRRSLPRFLKIKELIEGGAIGDVVGVTTRIFRPTSVQPNTPRDQLQWHFIPEYSGGGQVLDVGCHQIDLLNFYFGNIVEVQGFAANQSGLYPVVDSASAAFRFESGLMGSATWCFTAGVEVDETVIVGTKGQLSFAVFVPSPFTLTTAAGTQTIDLGYPAHVHQPMVESIIAELNGEGRCPSTGTSAAHASWVFDQILAGGKSA
ncbi:MAG: Gfo/Idh/MocA family oxidoreductase [Anaerolineae bacterium]